MSEFLTALGRFCARLTIWVAVAPWERGLRVRAGKHVKQLQPGVHWRVPFLDVVYVQSVRLRSSWLNSQTLMTADGHVATVGATVSYAIEDIYKLYNRMHHAEDTITNWVACAIAAHVGTERKAFISAEAIGEAATRLVSERLESCGLSQVRVQITDLAFTRAYRLIQDTRGAHSNNDILRTVAVP